MTKYRIRLDKGRVIGPFEKNQLFELKAKGHIKGNEEAQIFPTGNWEPIQNFDFYQDLMDENKTMVNSEKKDETFVIDLTKLRNQKNEKEIDKIDLSSHEPIANLTETIRLKSSATNTTPVPEPKPELDIELEKLLENEEPSIEIELDHAHDQGNKTLINPVAQQELEKMRRRQALEEQKKIVENEKHAAELELKLHEKEESNSVHEAVEDQATQFIKLDSLKDDLLLKASKQEKKLNKVAKAIESKKQAEAATESEEVDNEAEELQGKGKKFKLVLMLAAVALIYVMMFPNEDQPKIAVFKHLDPQIVYPIPFDQSDAEKSKQELMNGLESMQKGSYPELVKAGLFFKTSYENNLENHAALNLMIRSYAEQLKSSKNKLQDAQTLFSLIQSKRPFLNRDPNGLIGMNLFYLAMEKNEAAAEVIARYLKLNPKDLTQDLFASYLQTLIKTGKIDLAKQFYTPLLKEPKKNKYTLQALIDYFLLNQQTKEASDFIEEGIKKYPELSHFYLIKAKLLINQGEFDSIEPLLQKVEKVNFEYNDFYRAKYLEVKGLLLAYQGKSQEAAILFKKSLEIEDSNELRMALANLNADDDSTDAGKLISESKAIKYLLEARSFYEKKNYELAFSSAAKASDAYPGHIPSDLFLAKVQLKLGLVKESLATLEELINKYPDNPLINLALIEAYIDTYKFQDARNRIAIVAATDLKSSPEFFSLNARLNLKMGDTLQAISWLRNSMNLNPLNDNDIFLLAEILIKRANFEAARVLLNKSMELDPVNPDYRIAYAKIIYETQDDQAAIGYLLGLMDEFGENPKILGEIAIFYYRAGKVKDFQAFKEKIEKLPVKDKSLYEFLIRAAMLDERYDDVPRLAEQLLAIEPGDLETMMTAGKVLFENGKLIEAAKWFKRVQDRLASYPKVQYYGAKIKFLSKDFDGALAEVKKDMKENGDNDPDLVLMGQIQVEKGELVEAENSFKRAQKINRNSFDALVGLADLSTKRNNFELALDLYKRAMKEKSDEPSIHRKIGDVYRLLGQGTLAIESYKLYLEMNPEAADKAQIESYIDLMQ